MAISCSYFPSISPFKSIDRLSMDRVRIHGQQDLRCKRYGNTAASVDHNQKAPAVTKTRSTLVDEADRLRPFEGRLVENGLVFQQTFSVKSYEAGRDLTITVEALMNYMQDASLNHCKAVGLNAGGFGCTPEMCKRNLIWAARRTQISLHHYPSWGDVISANTWYHVSKRGTHREWLLRDATTGATVAKAASDYVFMNMNTRKMSTVADEIFLEITPHSRNCDPIIDFNTKKVRRVDINEADHVKRNLTPMWNDLDANSHVSNVKYITWILEGVPWSILDEYVLDSVYIEYRRECGRDSKLHSLSTKINEDGIVVDQSSRNEGMVGFEHLLLLDSGTEMARAGTRWRPRRS